jgi:glycosyltransferase involved in cell wall biosynthesis
MVTKNEWPLPALSITHALVNYAEKIYVLDNGSTDGTWQGLQLLQTLFPGRIVPFRYISETFDQQAVTQALYCQDPEVNNRDENRWYVTLDSDEFLIDMKKTSLAFLAAGASDYEAVVLEVKNFIPLATFDDETLDSYADIEFRATRGDYGNHRVLVEAVREGRKLLQHRNPDEKIFFRGRASITVGIASHLLIYGDGIPWKKWDSKIAFGAEKHGYYIAHLPYTSQSRFMERFRQKFAFSIDTVFTYLAEEEAVRDFRGAHITPGSPFLSESLENGYVLKDLSFREAIVSTIDFLKPSWEEILRVSHEKLDDDLSDSEGFGPTVTSARRTINFLQDKTLTLNSNLWKF